MNSPITSNHEHTTTCPRCQRLFECRVGSINLCQCQSVRLTEEQRQYIGLRYQGCLCADCLQHVQSDFNQPIHQP